MITYQTINTKELALTFRRWFWDFFQPRLLFATYVSSICFSLCFLTGSVCRASSPVLVIVLAWLLPNQHQSLWFCILTCIVNGPRVSEGKTWLTSFKQCQVINYIDQGQNTEIWDPQNSILSLMLACVSFRFAVYWHILTLDFYKGWHYGMG